MSATHARTLTLVDLKSVVTMQMSKHSNNNNSNKQLQRQEVASLAVECLQIIIHTIFNVQSVSFSVRTRTTNMV
jgi:hypothetical protein